MATYLLPFSTPYYPDGSTGTFSGGVGADYYQSNKSPGNGFFDFGSILPRTSQPTTIPPFLNGADDVPPGLFTQQREPSDKSAADAYIKRKTTPTSTANPGNPQLEEDPYVAQYLNNLGNNNNLWMALALLTGVGAIAYLANKKKKGGK